MKKRKGLLFGVIAGVILVVDISLFGEQILSIVMELPHGFHRDVHGIRLHTPMFYTSSTGIAYDEYNFMTIPSVTRNKNSMITVDFKKQVSDVDRPLSPEALKKIGLHMTGQRTVSMASKTGNCLEYMNEVEFTDISCSFGPDLHVHFFGSPNTVKDFYTFMAKAEVLPRNN